jgi:PTS system nitrogen regulatory IIA component
MGVSDILSPDHVSVATQAEGIVRTKPEAIRRLSVLLASGQPSVTVDEVERVLTDRERLQSTGVGGGVAIPHGSLDRLERTVGAVLLCPEPVDFEAIDGAPVSIFFAVVGPKRATGEHLKTLARVSRLLRDDAFRERLLSADSGTQAYAMIAAEDSRGSSS